MVTKDNLYSLLSIITPQILKFLMERKNIDGKEAAKLLYNSVLYAKLEDEKTKLWHSGAETLYALLEEELTTGKITWPEEQ